MKTLLISDSAALGLMEARPEPAWRVRMSVLRNKDLLAPDYGAMHVAAYLKSQGFPLRVINLVADVHSTASAFAEPHTDPEAFSGAPIASQEAAAASRSYLLSALRSENPDVIFVSLSIYNLALYTRRLLGEIKAACPGATLITGGIYSTFHAPEILADGCADAVVRGEGELTSAELLSRLSKKQDLDGLAGVSYRIDGRVIHNDARSRIKDLDSLPHPYTVSSEFKISTRFEILNGLLPGPDWIAGAGFLTSRGCPEGCAFCLDPAINERRTRFHSPGYVREVLEFCSDNFPGGPGAFFFGDATFTMNKKRLARILDSLPDFSYTYQIQTRADYLDARTVEGLAAAGVTNIAIGAETFNEEILSTVVRKRLEVSEVIEAARAVRATGMKPMLTFIVGLPGETRESILRTVEILCENELFDATFFPLVVFKGTELFKGFSKRSTPGEMDRWRVNPVSEEFLRVGDEFATPEELEGFAAYANACLTSRRLTPA